MSTQSAYLEDARRSEAADWVVRLQSADLDVETALAFDAWLESSPAHGAAYDAALAVANEYGREAAGVRDGLHDQRPQRRPLTRRFYLGAGALAAAAAVAVVVLPALQTDPAPQVFVTAKGQHRKVTLADGSRVELNGGTRLTVALRRDQRDVALQEGEALFDVTHDPRRPFLVAAGDRTVRVVGTQFDVRRRDGRVAVTVARGLVEVRPTNGQGLAYRLHPGQKLDHVDGAREVQVAAVSPDEVLGWRTGRLVYRGAPLSQVVADLNAQFEQPIVIEDPSLAATPISGVLLLEGGESAVVERLALLVSVRAVRSGPGVALRR